MALLFICLLLATEQEAKAYTDPGSGMILWQALCAGALGFLFYIRKFLGRCTRRKADTKDFAR